ncbi:MAG: co-chaperone GroES [Candidatus Doudnabacteria bacterium RIFCSPLOWO2_01_FULL_44_21]|uniref:Co-chaperonin GroES n=1 Tax=Candidatus Doudnabacteria bacterium RIFCSPLOWO2_01_FULL_44_21 TaxID=1817841 RepID=A0A1F5Q2N7_9BACT|nr:MAG: co-chaperone GroES [Candidatus Doudnabacteria bacterium RIFCSPHIGHO2_02_FULL_43_13b]OGE96426.1 MAG: co-chaperone GroES [Candidatus Doudnabacteria bacterium RIFCSPLOWO2_01_FULL_44_21]
MNIKPLGDRILVKPLRQEDVTKSGIVLPDTAEKEKKEQGEVIAIGEGDKIKKLKLKVGDKVLFGKYAGDEVEFNSVDGGAGKVDYKFLKDEDVLGIVE